MLLNEKFRRLIVRFFIISMLVYSIAFGGITFTLIKHIYLGYNSNYTVAKGKFSTQMLYKATRSGMVNFKIDNLSDDVDLYVKKGSMVSKSNWDCRPYKGGRSSEICSMDVVKGEVIHAAIYGYNAGSYHFSLFGDSAFDIEDISINETKDAHVEHSRWRYYKLNNLTQNSQYLNILMSNLTADVDLYVKKGALPTKSSYDCRPYHGGTRDEECNIEASAPDKLFIGIYGYSSSGGSYKLKVIKKNRKHAVLLLHGLASDHTTWDSFVNHKFFGKCATISTNGSINQPHRYTDDGYCFRLDFGKYDTTSGLKNLLGEPCKPEEGCKGDYSTFYTLGKEVSEAVGMILDKIGSDTDIILVGHSRGGIAASEYLGNNFPNRDKVISMITTGTPFLGSPLGKVYNYLQTNCTRGPSIFNTGTCRTDWSARMTLKTLGGLDVAAPSVGFLEQGINGYGKLINELQRGKRYYHNLVYKGVKLGDLFVSGSIVYNPFPSIQSFGSSIVGNFSTMAERFMVGNSPLAKAKELHGDGIVPYRNQDMSNLYGVYITGFGFTHSSPFYSSNNAVTYFNENIIHIDEPKRVYHLSNVLRLALQKRDSGQIPTLTTPNP